MSLRDVQNFQKLIVMYNYTHKHKESKMILPLFNPIGTSSYFSKHLLLQSFAFHTHQVGDSLGES